MRTAATCPHQRIALAPPSSTNLDTLAGPRPGVGPAGLARRWWRTYWDWRARELTVHILCSLDSRTLRDIGVDPSEIDSYVHSRRRDRRRQYDTSWLWRRGT
jgi:uncharacterized protein YjiS (DUF1127 family)